VKLAVCGEFVALSVNVREALRDPVVIGAKATDIVQCPPAGTAVPQSFVSMKSDGFAPVIAISLMESGDVPEFESVIGLNALTPATA
jgi:hypothetical protein